MFYQLHLCSLKFVLCCQLSTTFSESLENVCKITLHQRFPGKLRERCHNVERKLWKCCLLTLLQRNPGTLLKC